MKANKRILLQVRNKDATMIKGTLPFIDNVDNIDIAAMWQMMENRYRDYLSGLNPNTEETCCQMMFLEPEQVNKEYYVVMNSQPFPIYTPYGGYALRTIFTAEGKEITRLY